ncbi:hypothetical protein GDO81_019069 [Engystomops pustulosus]|uniref:Uncharacterized protein n=1 Tax=Engystomops pustulosus TaxID=76066 RepID=A0AAV6YEK6_ENGPU|nr:hypothetical protein GDO81_019069 [Engystomops pustulosus]
MRVYTVSKNVTVLYYSDTHLSIITKLELEAILPRTVASSVPNYHCTNIQHVLAMSFRSRVSTACMMQKHDLSVPCYLSTTGSLRFTLFEGQLVSPSHPCCSKSGHS